MSSKPLKACSYPNCYAVSDGYKCPEHRRSADLYRGSSTERGYDASWRRFRAWFIRRHPVCHDCQIEPTRDVHHIKKLTDFPALRLVEQNCLGLCTPCHSARTAKGE